MLRKLLSTDRPASPTRSVKPILTEEEVVVVVVVVGGGGGGGRGYQWGREKKDFVRV